jgi:hypothetical protein
MKNFINSKYIDFFKLKILVFFVKMIWLIDLLFQFLEAHKEGLLSRAQEFR